MLRENLDSASTVIGLDTKVLAGVVFADIVADEALTTDVRARLLVVGAADAPPAVVLLRRPLTRLA